MVGAGREPSIPQAVETCMYHGSVQCPRCAGPLVRIRRRRFDRLVSVFGARHRVQCVSCQWQGLRRATGTDRYSTLR